MIRHYWSRYINEMLKYIHRNENRNPRLLHMELLHIFVMFLLCFFIFYFIVGNKCIFCIFAVSIGYGRLIFDRIMIFYDKSYPYDKRYTPFLRFLSLSTVAFLTIGGTIKIIEEAQNYTNIQKIIQEQSCKSSQESNQTSINPSRIESNTLWIFDDNTHNTIQLTPILNLGIEKSNP